MVRLTRNGDVPMGRYADVLASLVAGWDVTVASERDVVLSAFLSEAAGEASARVGWSGERGGRQLARYAVSVVDGSESDDEWEGVAEDAFLHEGRGERSVRLLFAPRGTPPDLLMEALASFRAVVPAPEALSGRLAMPKAFLASAGTPHAYGDDLSFLISQGPPDVQPEGHLRWVNYDALGEVASFLAEHAGEVTAVAARTGLALGLPGGEASVRRIAHGEAHRPSFEEALSAEIAGLFGAGA
jgi:hypothetical protein